ncbi:MAG TPA: hypothetical protein VF227_07735 [Actinomycetes bacterium]
MSRLVALLVLTAAFAPAAVMGAMPVVAPVVIVLVGLALAVAAFDVDAPEPVVEPASPTVPQT